MHSIKFGTSGWRGIFCDDFTLENVRVVSQAIADYLRESGEHERGVVVGYDTRFMGRYFARETVRVLAAAGIKSYLCNRDTPSPVIAHEILRRKACGGINFTASHNPYDYNGLKFSLASGGPALPEITHDLEGRANAMLGEVCFKEMPMDQAYAAGLVEDIDPRPHYLEGLGKLVDFQAIAASGMTVAVNALHGAGRDYLDAVLADAGVKVVSVNNHPDPYFGGAAPEPCASRLGDFIELVKSSPEMALGLATDGDADRYGIIDADGTFIEPNDILPLLLDYLIRVKGQAGDVVRSVATSHFVDAVARHHGRRVYETPVGFKHIGPYVSAKQVLLGGEESAGLTIRGHVPDKDGILACLLVAEMVAVQGRTLKEQLVDLGRRVGEVYHRRDNIRLCAEVESGYAAKLATPPTQVEGRRVVGTVAIDGVKFLLEDGSWVLFRRSVTEPLVRVYCESTSPAGAERLVKWANGFLTE
ncbi:phosphoglucomutase [Desulfuromonas versatilis]|uniref:Phosphoglucomutase n=1 Tax=Desulfuromonas versatilis TaxID=2802975 RepID=A0ABM8HT45_9BACT|nr:phosphoglucomutase/phosphomannomutase family protein [Desulfuromonas versatilis]BCR05145.1 phosphoglucomutase [Desulfuromonas versatilis]